MKIAHIPITIKSPATAHNTKIITTAGQLTLPAFARIYLLSCYCQVSVRNTDGDGDPFFYHCGDDFGIFYDTSVPALQTWEKKQSFSADVMIRNSDGTVPIVAEDVSYSPTTGTLDSMMYNLLINPMGHYIPREPILLNLNPDYTIGLLSIVRHTFKSVTHYYDTSDIHAFTTLTLELGLQND